MLHRSICRDPKGRAHRRSRWWRRRSLRRGSAAVYLDVHHPEIEEFLEIRKPSGDFNRKSLNLHHGISISDAFMDADSLASALDEGWSGRRSLDEVLAEHQSTRDRRAKPMYDFTCQLATLEPAPPHMRQLFGALNGNREATSEFYSALTGSSPLPAFMNPKNLDRIISGKAAAERAD